jgi:pyruvate/2-oxoglutarate dehydrogenase complex dihydrolipoamide dehydrogenase (E3) component
MADKMKKDLKEVSQKMLAGVDIKDRTYHLKNYKTCFLGTDAVEWMLKEDVAKTADDAVLVGQQMMDDKLFYHVTRDAEFENSKKFYRFIESDDHGKEVEAKEGKVASWSDAVANLMPGSKSDNAAMNTTSYVSSALRKEVADLVSTPLLTELDVSPLDKHNTKLLDQTHPASWQNPTGKGKYTLVVVGGGTGGLVSAAGAAGVGAKVALIESHLTGGDCLNFGCVPSKALIRAARAVKEVKTCSRFGVVVKGEVQVDFGATMERLRELRADIAENDSYQRFTNDLGIDMYQGRAEFTSANTVKVNGEELHFTKAIVATGASAAVPNTHGLTDIPYLTNYTVFNLTELPPRICVIGAGPIGLELAQAFARFGSEVTCYVRGKNILPKEDRDAAEIVYKHLVEDGVNIHFQTSIVELKSEGCGYSKYTAPWPKIVATVKKDGKLENAEFDAVLVATGRRPNVMNMGLEEAGIKFSEQSGVEVNDNLQTSNTNVYAVGDVCTRFQFTHMADFMARTAIRNALFFGRGKQSSLLVPWATFTEPEVAHVGLYEADLHAKSIPFDTYTKYFKDVDRAILDGDTEGFVKIHCKKGTDEIVGATIVNPNAGNMISEITVAMQTHIGLGTLANIIHPYPTQAEAIRMCGDLYNKTRLTPTVKGLLGRVANRSFA